MTEDRVIIRRPGAKKKYALLRQFRLVESHFYLLQALAKELSIEAGRSISVSSLVRMQIKKLLISTGKLKKDKKER